MKWFASDIHVHISKSSRKAEWPLFWVLSRKRIPTSSKKLHRSPVGTFKMHYIPFELLIHGKIVKIPHILQGHCEEYVWLNNQNVPNA